MALVRLDLEVWYYLNATWHNEVLDAFIPFFRNQFFWAPLYLFLLVFVLVNFGKKGLFWCAAFLIAFGLADYTSASLIKPFVNRVRPCNNPYLADIVHLLVPCGGGKSFPSSHATNHFALAAFMAATLGREHRWVRWVVFLWAGLIAYSQVYVGVHYPLDVVCGGLLGLVIGTVVGRVFERRWGLYPPSLVSE